MGKSNFGGSLLPSHGPDTYQVLTGKHGTLKVIALPEIETHALMYEDTRKLGYSLVATHANGYSCKELADRILKAWENVVPSVTKRDGSYYGVTGYALAQFDYILECGGTGRSRHAIEWIVKQSQFHTEANS